MNITWLLTFNQTKNTISNMAAQHERYIFLSCDDSSDKILELHIKIICFPYWDGKIQIPHGIYLSFLDFLSASFRPIQVLSCLALTLLQMTWSWRERTWAAHRAAASGDITVLQPRPVKLKIKVMKVLKSCCEDDILTI